MRDNYHEREEPLLAFFYRALRTVKEYNEKVEYIHLNPVKAGLVSRARVD